MRIAGRILRNYAPWDAVRSNVPSVLPKIPTRSFPDSPPKPPAVKEPSPLVVRIPVVHVMAEIAVLVIDA